MLSAANRLKDELATRDAMSVADFMRWCLTEGENAYYRNGNPIGANGDFITAPEISQIFGELIAVWAMQLWQSMGEPQSFILAELGPGRGTLMQDALRAARSMPAFHDAAQVHLVESSEPLRAMQSERLSPVCKPQWHLDFSTLPQGPLIVIANEFLDALPVEQHLYTNGSWHQRVLKLGADGQPEFAAGRLAVPPGELLPQREPVEGDILEHRPDVACLVRELSQRSARGPVGLLAIDYGYERRDYGDTLQAVQEHAFAPPLDQPGEADISAHVNFAELAHAADQEGLSAWGPIDQSAFLLSLGLEARLRQLMLKADEKQKATLFLGARRLVDPFQMGSLFKAMAITTGSLPAPVPFPDHANLPIVDKAPYSGKDMGSGAA